jgi:hypothetical protein
MWYNNYSEVSQRVCFGNKFKDVIFMLKKKIAAAALSLGTAVVIPLSQVSALTNAAEEGYSNENVPYAVLATLGDSASDADSANAPQSPTVVSATTKNGALTVTWNKVNNADGYVLYRYDKSSGHYKYVYQYGTSYTWDDYSSYTDGYKYYILSFVKGDSGNVLSEAVDFTDSIKAAVDVAAPGKVTITKVGKAKDAIRLYWDKVDCDGYEVYVLDGSEWKFVATAGGSATDYRVGSLKSATKYTFKVRAFNKDADGNSVYGEYSNEYKATTKAEAVTAAPSKVKITKAGKAKDAIRVYWDVIDCDGYEVYIHDGTSWKLAGTVSGKTGNLRISGLKSSTKYTLTVRAFNKDASGNQVFGEFSDYFKATTKADTSATVKAPDKVKITKAGKGKDSIRVYWDKLDCDGYEIYVLDGSNWKLAGTVSGTVTDFKVTGLKSSTKYSFKVRAFNKKSDGTLVYGEYSDVYKATTKAAPAAVTAPSKVSFTKAGKGKTSIRMYWNAVDCAGYEIYVNDGTSWKLAATVSGTATNYKISGLKSSTTYYFAIRAFNRNSSGGAVFGEFSDNFKATTKS